MSHAAKAKASEGGTMGGRLRSGVWSTAFRDVATDPHRITTTIHHRVHCHLIIVLNVEDGEGKDIAEKAMVVAVNDLMHST